MLEAIKELLEACGGDVEKARAALWDTAYSTIADPDAMLGSILPLLDEAAPCRS